jgi:hypothetical protein
VRAGGDTFGNGPQRLVPLHAAGPLARYVAAADVDVHGVASTEAHLDEPVQGGGLCLLAADAFDLASFFGGDLIVHVFDTTSAVAALIAGQEVPVNVTDLLRSLALDPADLKPAPARAATAQEARERLGPDPVPCVACGTPVRSTRIIVTPEHGRRWLDLCRECMLATVDRGRPTMPLADTMAVLREAAREAGVALTVLVDEPPPRP